jgi:hypothetical protein
MLCHDNPEVCVARSSSVMALPSYSGAVTPSGRYIVFQAEEPDLTT